MEQLFHLALEFVKNVGNPDYINQLITQYTTVFYGVFFLIIFVETGLVVMPLLPGDSLLFVVGAAIAATGALKMEVVIPLLIFAALLGDNVNYFVGYFLGEQIKKRDRILFFKREYLDQTHAFYEKNGGEDCNHGALCAHCAHHRTFCSRRRHYEIQPVYLVLYYRGGIVGGRRNFIGLSVWRHTYR